MNSAVLIKKVTIDGTEFFQVEEGDDINSLSQATGISVRFLNTVFPSVVFNPGELVDVSEARRLQREYTRFVFLVYQPDRVKEEREYERQLTHRALRGDVKAFVEMLKRHPSMIGGVRFPRSGGAISRAEAVARMLKINANSPTSKQVLDSLDDKVSDFIRKYRKGSIQRELPSDVL